jgi:dihydrolipoyl dehydrogenase
MVVGSIAESTEVAVIGAGMGGYVAAIRLAQWGKEVTLISNEESPGGVCLLRGCIPSKALITAAQLFQKIQRAQVMGIQVDNPRLDWEQLQSWKEAIIKKLTGGVKQLLKQNGVQWKVGEARFVTEKSLEIRGPQGVETLQFQQAIVATGSLPRSIPGFDFDGKKILSSTEALSLKSVPKNLLVIGGGYIGLELGGVFAAAGTKVTVVEATDQLLPGLDPDLLRPLKKRLKELGVEVYLKTLATQWTQKNNAMEITLQDENKKVIQGSFDQVLVSVGRAPDSKNLGLEKAKVKVDAKGFISINERCQTNQPHIYAVGDVTGGMMLAHKAAREGKVAAANIAGHSDGFDNQVPAIVFTDPEIAYVGLQESEALAKGLEIETGMFPFVALGRALTMDETEGFIKVVAEKSSGRVLGVQMVGPHVSDLIAEATLGMEMGATLEDFSLTIHAHPTLPEALEEAMESVLGMPIHRFQRKKS